MIPPVSKRDRRAFLHERLIEALNMFDDGASKTEVMRTLHLSSPILSAHLPGRGWTKAEGGRFSRATKQNMIAIGWRHDDGEGRSAGTA